MTKERCTPEVVGFAKRVADKRATYEQRRDLLVRAQDLIRLTLVNESLKRSGRDYDEWEAREHHVVVLAANNFAQIHGLPGRVTLDDVRRVETRALGHVDYADKFALYVAEELFR